MKVEYIFFSFCFTFLSPHIFNSIKRKATASSRLRPTSPSEGKEIKINLFRFPFKRSADELFTVPFFLSMHSNRNPVDESGLHYSEPDFFTSVIPFPLSVDLTLFAPITAKTIFQQTNVVDEEPGFELNSTKKR